MKTWRLNLPQIHHKFRIIVEIHDVADFLPSMWLIVPWDLTLVYIRTQCTTWKCLFFVFIKDTNTRQWISLSLFKLECGPQEINCREIRLNLTFSTNWNKRGKVFKLREFILKVTFSLPSLSSSMLKQQQTHEFTVFQTWSLLFHVIHFVKFWVNFSGRNLRKS